VDPVDFSGSGSFQSTGSGSFQNLWIRIRILAKNGNILLKKNFYTLTWFTFSLEIFWELVTGFWRI